MIVFPAFNSNFKSRKRNFRCCVQCRTKRKKCEVSPDSQSKGCVRCELYGTECSLITKPTRNRSEESTTSFSGLYSPASNHESFDTARDPSQSPFPPLVERDEGIGIEDTTSYTSVDKAQKHDASPKKLEAPEPGIEDDAQLENLAGYNFNLSPETFSFDMLKRLFGYSVPGSFANVGRDFSSWSDAKAFFPSDLVVQQANGKFPTVANSGSCMLPPSTRNLEPPSRPALQFLHSIYAFTISSPSFHFELRELKRLYEIYFFKINNILPMVHETKFWELYDANTHSTIVSLAMVLLVSKDNLAKPILKRVFWRSQHKLNLISSPFESFSDEQYIKALKAFQQDVETKVRQSLLTLDPYPEITKVVRLSVSLLLSLSCGFGKFGGIQCSSDVDRAIALALSMHLHIRKSYKDMLDDGGLADENRSFCSQLFWCCWLFDRFNAMVNNRLIVIKNEDFNLEPPYKHMNLLRLIEVAQVYESMCIYVYQPGYPSKMAEFTNAGLKPPKSFNLIEFETAEFEFCDNEIANNSPVYTPFLSPDDFKKSSPTYVSNTIHFLTRIMNNTTIAIAQELKFRDPNIDNDVARSCMIKASSHILWYSKKLDDDFKLNIPPVPFILTLALGCSLSRYANTKISPTLFSVMPHFDLQEHINELQKYRMYWKSVDELCFLLEHHLEIHANRKKRIFDRSNCERSSVVDGTCFNNTTLTDGPESAVSIRNIIHHSDDNAYSNKAMDLDLVDNVFSQDLNKFVENELFFNCVFKSYTNQ